MGAGGRRMLFGLLAAASGCLAAPGGSDSDTPDAAAGDRDAGGDGDAGSCIARTEFPAFEDAFEVEGLFWAGSVNVEPKDSPMIAEITNSVLTVELVDFAGHMLWIKTPAFDLGQRRLVLEMVELPNPAVTGARGWMAVLPDNQPAQAIQIMYLEDALETPNGVVDYSPVDDRWWQIRATGSALVIETSSDGIGWKQLDSVPRPLGLESAVFEIGTKTDTDEPTAGRFVVDNLNLPPDRCP